MKSALLWKSPKENQMGKHTPGPWHSRVFTNIAKNTDRLHIMSESKRMIAAVTNHPGHAPVGVSISQEDRSNAALIAAAPDLFAALFKCATALMYSEEGTPDAEAFLAAEEALTKAEGGKPTETRWVPPMEML